MIYQDYHDKSCYQCTTKRQHRPLTLWLTVALFVIVVAAVGYKWGLE
jgi:hypothetical protein